MATVYSSVYYDCLQEFRSAITAGITQTDFNVGRLREKARKKGLPVLPSARSPRPDSVAPRDKSIATFVSTCIEGVKEDEKLFYSFLAVLDEVGLEHLVRRVRRRLEQGGNQKRPQSVKKHGTVPPLSDSTATSQSLPPLPRRKTSPSQQSHSRNEGAPTDFDQQSSRSETRLCPITFSGNREGKAPSPVCSEGSSPLPVEQTQEDDTEDLVMSKMDSGPLLRPNRLSTESMKSLAYDKEQAEAKSTMLQQTNQELIKDKETLQKTLREKETEINRLKTANQRMSKKIQNLKEQMSNYSQNKKELEELRKTTAELQRELEERDKKIEELKKEFTDLENKVTRQHEQEVENLKAKAEANEDKLSIQLLKMDLETRKTIDEYKDRERALERERDVLKDELRDLHKSIMEEKFRILQQEKDEADRKCQAAEQQLKETKKLNDT